MTTSAKTTLKEALFGADRIRHIAAELRAVSEVFDSNRFQRDTLARLDALSLMERLHHVTETLHACLPLDYRASLTALRALAPGLNNGFVTMVLPDFVALYGAHDFDVSMQALRFFTTFGSSEFAVRHFLRVELARTLAVMEDWSLDPNEHVRRLASEGSRPRLPWSFRIEALVVDPTPTARILDNLQRDPSLYVRKSVANHLNDITKDHPGYVIERLRSWPLEDKATAWIARHALRSLIKQGQRDALAIIGAGEQAEVRLSLLKVTPAKIKLGDAIALSLRLQSTSEQPQKLVVDYAILYVRRERTSRKVFKLKSLTLAAGATALLARSQTIEDFSTRKHHAGKHEVELMVNGQVLGRTSFLLQD